MQSSGNRLVSQFFIVVCVARGWPSKPIGHVRWDAIDGIFQSNRRVSRLLASAFGYLLPSSCANRRTWLRSSESTCVANFSRISDMESLLR